MSKLITLERALEMIKDLESEVRELKREIQGLEDHVEELEDAQSASPEDEAPTVDVVAAQEAWKDFNREQEPWKSIAARRLSEALEVTL